MQLNRTVLLVAEDPKSLAAVTSAFTWLGMGKLVSVVPDGRMAIQYLMGEEPFDDRERFPIPGLILLDLDKRPVTGCRFIEWLRRHATLRDLPVVCLAWSDYSQDLDGAFDSGANSFLVKKPDPMEYAIALKQAADFWLRGDRLAHVLPVADWLVSSPKVLGSPPNIGWAPRADNDYLASRPFDGWED